MLLVVTYHMNKMSYCLFSIKDGLSLKIKNLQIHLYFIATQYLSNYDLMEDIDN